MRHVVEDPKSLDALQILKPQLVQVFNTNLQLCFRFLELLLQGFHRLFGLSDVSQDVAVTGNALVETIVVF